MKIAFIGLGTMGVGMSLNILKAGHEVTVYNKKKKKEEAIHRTLKRWSWAPMALSMVPPKARR